MRRACAVLAGLVAVLGVATANAQVASLDLASALFVEPSAHSKLTVLNPSATLAVSPSNWLTFTGNYEADIVSGASESLKGGRLSAVDIVTSATHFSDTRHALTGGFTITRAATHLTGSYTYGTEHDYRSNAFAVSAGTDFLQKNTQIELSYGRGFDEVCTTAYRASDAPSTRLALDNSAGCFKNGKNRATPDGANPSVALDKPDVVNGVNAINRESEAVQGESTIEQYSDIVEKYFKAITKEPKKPTKP